MVKPLYYISAKIFFIVFFSYIYNTSFYFNLSLLYIYILLSKNIPAKKFFIVFFSLIYRTQHKKNFICVFSLLYMVKHSPENFFICDSLIYIYKKYITKIFSLRFFYFKIFFYKNIFRKNFSPLFFNRKNFLIVKKFLRENF